MGGRLFPQRARRQLVPVPEAEWPGQLPRTSKRCWDIGKVGRSAEPEPSLDEDGAERLAGGLARKENAGPDLCGRPARQSGDITFQREGPETNKRVLHEPDRPSRSAHEWAAFAQHDQPQ